MKLFGIFFTISIIAVTAMIDFNTSSKSIEIMNETSAYVILKPIGYFDFSGYRCYEYANGCRFRHAEADGKCS